MSSQLSPQEQGFLNALTRDRCDTTTRLVYADWLDENDRPEEASEQRRMASPEWVEAAQWMERTAREMGQHCEEGYADSYYAKQEGREVVPEKWVPITFDLMVKAGRDYLNSGGTEWFTQVGDETLRDSMYAGDNLATYWKNWSMITGIPLPETPGEVDDVFRQFPSSPFSCSC